MLKYKEYVAKTEYDDGTKSFGGYVLGTKVMLYFEGKTVEGMIDSFHKVVDGYLETCRRKGIEPEKPFSGKLNIRMESDLHRKLALVAERADTSMNQYIVDVLAEAVTRSGQADKREQKARQRPEPGAKSR